MKLLFILIPILSTLEVANPIHIHKIDKNLIQNTNIQFDKIDFTKLEINFYQIGCFNHDRYRLNFTRENDKLYVNVYGFSTRNCEKIKSKQENLDEFLVSRLITNEDLIILKDILITDKTATSTMNNKISINYNGGIYTFYDNSVAPNWRKFIYDITNS